MLGKLLVAILLSAVFSSCENCHPDEMKCEGSKVMLCKAGGYWDKLEDCGDLETVGLQTSSKWVCRELEEETKCVLSDSIEGEN